MQATAILAWQAVLSCPAVRTGHASSTGRVLAVERCGMWRKMPVVRHLCLSPGDLQTVLAQLPQRAEDLCRQCWLLGADKEQLVNMLLWATCAPCTPSLPAAALLLCLVLVSGSPGVIGQYPSARLPCDSTSRTPEVAPGTACDLPSASCTPRENFFVSNPFPLVGLLGPLSWDLLATCCC